MAGETSCLTQLTQHCGIQIKGKYCHQEKMSILQFVFGSQKEALPFSQGVNGMKTYSAILLLFQNHLQLPISLFHRTELKERGQAKKEMVNIQTNVSVVLPQELVQFADGSVLVWSE